MYIFSLVFYGNSDQNKQYSFVWKQYNKNTRRRNAEQWPYWLQIFTSYWWNGENIYIYTYTQVTFL